MQPLDRALLSFQGLTTGDGFGEQFFGMPEIIEPLIAKRKLPEPKWSVTDDSVMAAGVVQTLKTHDFIDQNALAMTFATNYMNDPSRGYGGTAHSVLRAIYIGNPWKVVAENVFDGMGSMGNGAAMRAAPIGAYFADNYKYVAAQAALSAEVTHANLEGKAGAVAVAVATASAWQLRNSQGVEAGKKMLQTTIEYTPDSDTCSKISKALHLNFNYDVRTAASALGNGTNLTAQDTVPFTLWCVARHFGSYAETLWTTVSGLGDRDTTCAIAGGIAVMSSGKQGIPPVWLESTEKLDLID